MVDKNLAIGMSDSERYERLKDRSVDVTCYDTEKFAQIDDSDYSALRQIRTGGALKILRKIGEDFGVFKRGYTTQDVEFEFGFSRGNLEESINKQHGQFQNYAKMMTVFDEVISNAVGIEVQGDRYNNPDSRLDSMFVFVSAFSNDNGIVPVLLKVKTYIDETISSLYVAVSFIEIEKSRISAYIPDEEIAQPYPPRLLTVNLANLLSNVNTDDRNL